MRAIHRNRRRPPIEELVGRCDDVGRDEATCMSDCCAVNGKTGTAPAVMACPVNGTRSRQVDILTVKSLVRQLPLGMPNTQYYFCDSPDCEVVYFGLNEEASRFRREDLLVRVGTKEATEPIPVCYCFGFTRHDIWEEIRGTAKSTVAER